jgi:hypothetical protein
VEFFFHRPDLLGVSYLLLSFDRKDVLADALGIGRRVQDFFGRIGEDLDPMIDITSVTVRIVPDPQLCAEN